MIKLLKGLLLIAGGIALGIGSALWMAGLIGNKSALGFATVNMGGWRGDPTIGDKATNPYVRARVARFGLLALSRQEAIYFIRTNDDQGRALNNSCTYEMTGTGQEADWWSVTLYTESRLPMNDGSALSVDATTFAEQHGHSEKYKQWSAVISPTKPKSDKSWISSDAAENFDLTLRLYRPSAMLLTDPQMVFRPPSIKRISCKEGPS